MPPRKLKQATQAQPEASEVDLPLGIKFKGASFAKALPISGWIAALGTGYYFVSGPVVEGLHRLESRVSAVEMKLETVGADQKEMQRDVRRLYRMESRVYLDARGDEVAARAEPTATAREFQP